MRSDELLTATRRAAFIPDSHPEYTDAVVLSELNATLANVFGAEVSEARGGYWLKRYFTVTVADQARYRIPARALAGGLERIEIATSAGLYRPLTEATPAEIPDAMGSTSASSALPRAFFVEGDHVVLLPKPSVANLSIAMSYYIRPSQLVAQQASGTIRGKIATGGINKTARTLTVNAIPYDETGTPAVITSGSQKIDVVKPDGWHELALVGATQTYSMLVITVGGTDSMDDIEVGDYVRVADQTDWPVLPDEFHQTLCDATAVRIMQQLGMDERAATLAAKIGLTEQGDRAPGTDMARFVALLRPRVKNQPKVVVRRNGLIQQMSRYRRFH